MGEIIKGNFDKTPEEDKPRYIPGIRFEEFGLVVSFDHNLQAKPEDLNKVLGGPRQVTSFVIHPGRGLYVGLYFVPRNILSEVLKGLRTYREDEQLTEEQLSLVNLGVQRLEEFLYPKKPKSN